jgi:hypothetical protein
MPDQQTTSRASFSETEEQDVQQDWPLEAEEPARRPRRRLTTPLPMTLTAILLVACGFIGGVLVQKGQGASGGSGGNSGLAARFAALRGGSAPGGAARSGGSGTGSTSGAAPGAGALTGRATGAGSTVGQVAFLKGSTLYVTDTAGNTVEVKAAPGATISKTVSSSVKAIHPGETVLVSGSTGASGTISAQSIRVGSAATSGLANLFGGGASTGGSGAASTGASGTGEPSLFGKG